MRSEELFTVAFTYIVECSDGTYYTGWTTDLKNRLEAHDNGTGARYTRGRGPVRLVYYEKHLDKKTAQSREHSIKRLTRLEKQKLVSGVGGEVLRDLEKMKAGKK